LVKAFHAGLAPPAAMARVFRNQAERLYAEVATYERLDASIRLEVGNVSPSHHVFYGLATLRLGIRRTRTEAQWCEWFADQLRPPKKSRKNVHM
jgi:transposase